KIARLRRGFAPLSAMRWERYGIGSLSTHFLCLANTGYRNWPRTLLWCAYSHRRPAHRSRSLTIQLNVRQRQVDALPSALQILREAFGILELLKNFRKSKSPLGKISLKARHASRN